MILSCSGKGFSIQGASTSAPVPSITRAGLLGLLQSSPNGVFLTFPLRKLLLPPMPDTHEGGEKALDRSDGMAAGAPPPPIPLKLAAPIGPEEPGKEPETPPRACKGSVTKT